MKVAGFPSDGGACAWYRVILPLQHLGGALITQDFAEIERYEPDVLLCQRISKPEMLADIARLQQRGTRIVHDLDDDLWHLPMTNPCASMYGVGKPATRCLEEAIAMADVVTCATHGLAEVLRKFRSDVVVIENAVADSHFNHARPPITGRPKREGQIRIGYAGSPSHRADVETIAKPLRRIMKRFPQVRTVSVGQALPVHQEFADRTEHDFGIVPSPGESAQDFMGRYYWLLRAMDIDIAVAPLEDCVFNRGKSAVKLLEFGLAGIPVVASRVGPYVGRCQVLGCGDNDMWEHCLELLITEAEMREGYASHHRNLVGQNDTITSRAAAWREVLTA